MSHAVPTAVTPHRTAAPERPLRVRVAAVYAVVVALHVLAAALLLGGYGGASPSPVLLAALVTAYGAGLKHSYDWDHISAIDNSTRKFVSEGGSPAGVGLAFSLGHSLVVTLAAVLAVAGAGLMQGAFADGSPANRVLGLIGTGVSGGYLLLLGVYNGVSALRLRGASAVRHPGPAEEPTGLVTRLLRAPLRRVRSPRDIFVIGFLFGLGFDTATTIGLLLLAVSVSAAGIPLVTLLALPVAFTAAMTLCDTTNGLGMMRLYSSALQQSERRRRFNLVVTSVSAVSALFIAVLTLGAFVHELLGLTDPVTTWLAEVDLGHAGLALVGVFALIWLCAALLEHRRGRVCPVGDGA